MLGKHAIVMILCIACLWVTGQSDVNLPGKARPVLLSGDASRLWVLRQADGKMPAWWAVRKGVAQKVTLPVNSRFAAPVPTGKGLLAIVGMQARLFDIGADGATIETGSFPLPQGPRGVHPRLDGVFEKLGDRHFLTLFEPGHLFVLEATQNLALKSYSVALAQEKTSGQVFGEGAFFQPKTIAGFSNLVWMEQDQCFLWNPQKPDAVSLQPLPTLKSMEQAVPIPTQSGLNWLIHGGERGDLGSFGWRLVNDKGNGLAKGKGIVTRFGFLRDAGPQRLLIWTVSQKVRSQLWAAMSGSRNFTGQVLQYEKGKWQLIQKTEVKLAKGNGDVAFEILWQADVNQDGRSDLAVTDEKHGIRIFLSDANGQFSKNARKMGRTPHEMLIFDHRLFACEKKGSRWQLSQVNL